MRLDRLAAEKRLWPAIDVEHSSTLREETLFDDKELAQVQKLRRALAAKNSADNPQGGLEHLVELVEKSADNAKLLAKVK